MRPVRGQVEVPPHDLMAVRVIRGHAAAVLLGGRALFAEIGFPVEPLVLEQVAPKIGGEVALEEDQVNLFRGLPVGVCHAPDHVEMLRMDLSIKLGEFLVQLAIRFVHQGQAFLGLFPDVTDGQADLVGRPFDGELLGDRELVRESLDFDRFLPNDLGGFGQVGSELPVVLAINPVGLARSPIGNPTITEEGYDEP